MDNANDKCKEFIKVLSKLKKVGHKLHKNNSLYPGEFMMLKTISKCMSEKIENEDSVTGVKISELSKTMRVTKPATSKMLNILEEKNYIKRISDKNDRRVVYANLTKKGEDTLKESAKSFENVVSKIIFKMGEEDADNLIRLFNKLYDIVSEDIN